jgi:hypothetical protein
VEIIVVDDEYIGRSSPQLPSREQAAEPTAHNDDAWTPLTLQCSSPDVAVEMGMIMADSRGFVPVLGDRGGALHRSRPRPGRRRGRARRNALRPGYPAPRLMSPASAAGPRAGSAQGAAAVARDGHETPGIGHNHPHLHCDIRR